MIPVVTHDQFHITHYGGGIIRILHPEHEIDSGGPVQNAVVFLCGIRGGSGLKQEESPAGPGVVRSPFQDLFIQCGGLRPRFRKRIRHFRGIAEIVRISAFRKSSAAFLRKRHSSGNARRNGKVPQKPRTGESRGGREIKTPPFLQQSVPEMRPQCLARSLRIRPRQVENPLRLGGGMPDDGSPDIVRIPLRAQARRLASVSVPPQKGGERIPFLRGRRCPVKHFDQFPGPGIRLFPRAAFQKNHGADPPGGMIRFGESA